MDYTVIAAQAGATLNSLMSHAQDLVAKLRSLQFDQREFVCLKFLVLFSLGKEPCSDSARSPRVTRECRVWGVGTPVRVSVEPVLIVSPPSPRRICLSARGSAGVRVASPRGGQNELGQQNV